MGSRHKLSKCSGVRNQGGLQLQCSEIGELAWAGFLVLCVFLLEYRFFKCVYLKAYV